MSSVLKSYLFIWPASQCHVVFITGCCDCLGIDINRANESSYTIIFQALLSAKYYVAVGALPDISSFPGSSTGPGLAAKAVVAAAPSPGIAKMLLGPADRLMDCSLFPLRLGECLSAIMDQFKRIKLGIERISSLWAKIQTVSNIDRCGN